MEQQVGPRFLYHVVKLVLEYFGVDNGGVEHPLLASNIGVFAYVKIAHVGVVVIIDYFPVGGAPVLLFGVESAPPLLHAVDYLLIEPEDMLLAADIAQVGQDVDQSAGSHAAEVPVSLDEHRFSAVPGRGDGRGDASRTSPHHHDIGLPEYLDFSGGFSNCSH